MISKRDSSHMLTQIRIKVSEVRNNEYNAKNISQNSKR